LVAGAGGVGGSSSGAAGAGAGGSGGGASGAGSGGSGFEIVPPEPTFRMVKFVLQSTQEPCVSSDCHGLNTENILELAIDDRLYTTLTTHVSVNCGNIPVVTPGDVTRSALAKILRGPCGETPRMPRDCMDDPLFNTCVYPEYLDAIDLWISMGAPQ
jgi:hypothetical protein